MLVVLVGVLIASYELFKHRASRNIGSSPAVVVTGVTEDRPLPDVILTGAGGESVELGSLHAKVVVLAPFATLCSASCAATTSAFAGLESDLRKSGINTQVALVELSVDPVHDSPSRLASFARLTGTGWTLLSGSPAQVAKLWGALGQYYRVGRANTGVPRDWLSGAPATHGVTYSHAVYFIGDGKLRIADFAGPRAALDAGARRLVAAEGLSRPGPALTGWTVDQAFGNIEVLFNRRLPL